MEGFVSGFGLGYGAAGTTGAGEAEDQIAGRPSPTNNNDVDAMMTSYLKQCMDYHEDRMKEEELQSAGAGQFQQQGAPLFVSNSSHHVPPQEAPPPEATFCLPESSPCVQQLPLTDVFVPREAMAKAESVAKKLQQYAAPPPAKLPAAIPSLDEARTKALAVVASFSHQQQQHQVQPVPAVIGATTTTRRTSPLELTPEEHVKRRRAHFQREQERFHQALMRNFSYVARKEEQRLQAQLHQIENQKKYAEELRKAQAKQLQERKKQMMLVTTAGLGTKQRRKVEKRKRKMGHTVHQEQKKQQDDTVAVYLMGLQTSATEDKIRPLFESYGTLQKVHFYRNKSTGELKGDCLLVYQLGDEGKRDELLESVCGQVS
mmetsp:Transcript_36052/g.53726  ORF Transcript_36052/g.53726 Transcript_36052/m.53726 type:complete len:374 (-) Transcript_36052:386-1507(-)